MGLWQRKKALTLSIFTLLLMPLLSESGALKKKIIKKATPKTSTPSIETPTSSNILISNDPYEQCKATVLPSFINNSMYWGPPRAEKKLGPLKIGMRIGKSVYNGLNALSPPSVIVTNAGNKHPAPLPSLKSAASKNFNLIIVGSLNSDGTKSAFSQEGEAVHIAAPSNYELTSATKDGSYRKFGGTSGATPLVTGALAGFEWLSGYHPTAQESKILLEKTAIKTPISKQKPRKSGMGMLNSYKMAMVGKELKRLCGRNISCFKKNIQNPAIYRFPEDPGLKTEVLQAFPECHRKCGGTEESCRDKATALKKLRKAAFLNPSNRSNWKLLACIYKNSGLTENAKGFFNTYKSLLPEGPTSACQSNADCVLVPHCSSHNLSAPALKSSDLKKPIISFPVRPIFPFLPMTKKEAEIHYTNKCSKKEICQKTNFILQSDQKKAKRAENQEVVSKCVNSKCVLRENVKGAEPTTGLIPSQPQIKEKPQSIMGGSGQR